MDKSLHVSFPELVFVAGTRAIIGLGAGLLLANAMSRSTRKAIGLPLFLGGLLTTIPIAMHIFGVKDETTEPEPIAE